MQAQCILRVNEVFYSVQGEGHNTGMACVFVRFSGCNMDCRWCDTKYHDYYFELSVSQLLNRITQYPCHNVVLTGGEPTLQDLDVLVHELHKRAYWIAIETNGTRAIELDFDWVTVSPKGRVLQERGDELKVVFHGDDVMPLYEKYPHFHYYFLQPLSMQNIAETIEYVKQHPEWRLSLQCQKLIHIK